jgi:hypothetical protein
MNSKPGIEFPGPTFLRPYHFAVLANQVHRLGATHVRVPEAFQGYASRMRLWQSVGLEPPSKVNERNPGGRFHPLELLAQAFKRIFPGRHATEALVPCQDMRIVLHGQLR